MTHVFIVPNWFFGYDVLFEVAFTLITLFVGIYAYKIYKLSGQRQSKLFSIAFFFISISYFSQFLLNFIIISELNQNVCDILKISSINLLNSIGIYAYILFFIMGLITLTYTTLKVKSKRTYSLLLITIILSIVLAVNKLYIFYLISSILLAYVLFHYLMNYLNKKEFKTFIVMIAFSFLLFSSIHFIFSVNHGLFYVIGHFLELIAYILILINLILVFKK